MNLSKEQIAAAINAGTSLTDPESDLLDVFRRHAGGIMVLRQLLIAIGSGQITLGRTMQEGEGKTPDTPAPGSKGPAASKRGKAPKKRNKKK